MEDLLKVGTNTARVIKKGFLTVIGSSNRTKMWSDILIDGRPLKMTFPRCYALVVRKSGRVQEFSNWVGEKWVWNINTRCQCFD